MHGPRDQTGSTGSDSAKARVTGAHPATRRQRLFSWSVDATGVTIMGLLAGHVLPATFAILAFVGAAGAYLVWLPLKGQQRLGHRVAQIELVDIYTRATPTARSIVARSATVVVLSLPMLVGWAVAAVTMWFHPRRRTWHDMISGTDMVSIATGGATPAGHASSADTASRRDELHSPPDRLDR